MGPNSDQFISRAIENDVHALGLRGIRALAVAKTNDDEAWEFLGLLTFLDPPRPDTKLTIENARKYGADMGNGKEYFAYLKMSCLFLFYFLFSLFFD